MEESEDLPREGQTDWKAARSGCGCLIFLVFLVFLIVSLASCAFWPGSDSEATSVCRSRVQHQADLNSVKASVNVEKIEKIRGNDAGFRRVHGTITFNEDGFITVTDFKCDVRFDEDTPTVDGFYLD